LEDQFFLSLAIEMKRVERSAAIVKLNSTLCVFVVKKEITKGA